MKIYTLMCIHEKPCELAEASAMPYASFDPASDQMKKEYGEVMQKLESEEVAVVKSGDYESCIFSTGALLKYETRDGISTIQWDIIESVM